MGALALSAVVTGCTALPTDVDRPVSTALPSPERTTLGQLVERRRAGAGARHPSGFMLLSGPQAAYGSRLALVEAAEKTLDLQYYAIHADASTERLLRSVVDAARRGVRVRVLLDDFHSTGRDAQVMRLAFVPNIEMRMFNPVTGARSSSIGRIFGVLADFSRAQQRMHNKLFIADNVLGVTGGRNLGDAYFGSGASGNFVDMDVLAAGPIVQELSHSFDSYWNNERAYPVQSLVSREELDAMRERLRASDAQSAPPAAEDRPALPEPAKDLDADQRSQLVWDQQPMDLAIARFVWAPAAVLVDKPAKIPADGPQPSAQSPSSPALPDRAPAKASPMAATAAMSAPARPRAMRSPQPTTSASSAPPAPSVARLAALTAAPEAQTDTVVDGMLQLMGRARQDLLIVSPYFVPGADMKQAFAAARARGVRIRVLTNSLASNDAPLAHAGYARHRPDLLAMGVELYEMRSELPGGLRSSIGLSGSGSGRTTGGAEGREHDVSGSVGSSRAMLHSKLLIVDGRLLAVGSMNLDLRSQLQNTEIALLIRSSELARLATAPIENALRDAAWRVQWDGRRLVWRAPQGSGLEDATHEPDASLPLRLMLQLLGPLAPDHLL